MNVASPTFQPVIKNVLRRLPRYTRQDDAGTRHGFECPEERDYYPYWHPTPWRDIAVFTDDTHRCNFYKRESQNHAKKGYCNNTALNSKAACLADDAPWYNQPAWRQAGPACLENAFARENHHGNGQHEEDHESMVGFNWTIPADAVGRCVLRVRYNISTGEARRRRHRRRRRRRGPWRAQQSLA